MNKKRKLNFWDRSYVTEEEYQAYRKKSVELSKKILKFQYKLWIWMLIVVGGIIVIVMIAQALGIDLLAVFRN